MLHAGLDLSRKKLDVCLLSDQGEHLDQLAVPPDVDSLRTLARRVGEVHRQPVCAVIESMTGARIVHDTLEQQGWSVEIADAQKVKGLAPLACKTDKIDSKVLAVLSHRDLVPAIWLPDPRVRDERELARFRLHLVKHKSALRCRIQSTLINFGRACPGPSRTPQDVLLVPRHAIRSSGRPTHRRFGRVPTYSSRPGCGPSSNRTLRLPLRPTLSSSSTFSSGVRWTASLGRRMSARSQAGDLPSSCHRTPGAVDDGRVSAAPKSPPVG
jgi:hypothetical protein